LPVAIRLPFTVGGTAASDAYTDLSPSPSEGLLFLAGETRKEITLTLKENSVNRGKTIVLTLAERSEIGLRRSDGSGPDAPHLEANGLLHPYYGIPSHTVTISGAGTGKPEQEKALFVPVLLTSAGLNDSFFTSDGSFVFPLTPSSLVGTMGQTLPVIIETGNFQSELTVTNFSATQKTVTFSFVAEAVERDDDTATFSLTLKAGEQTILPDIVEELRGREVAGIGPANRAYVGALFATPAEGEMSGIVIGARTGAPDKRSGQYSLFYNGVPYGAASVESAWIYGLQQNEENRSNLALVNTGEIDDSPSTFEITIYDGSGESEPRTKSVTLAPRRWHQENGILGRIIQGYVQVRKTSGNNPFITYGVINDGGKPGERSGDGAYLLSQE